MRNNLNRHQFRTYYHGTNAQNAEGIEKHGLQPHTPGEWLFEEGEHDPGHPPGVYLTRNIDTARGYGDAVFAVDLPDSADWGGTESEGHVLNHGINPVVLRRVE